MEDPLQERTTRLLTDYLRFCAREPGSPVPPPSSAEAALLRSLAATAQERFGSFFARYRASEGDCVELMEQIADYMFCDGRIFNWGRVVTLITLAGTLLERRPQATARGRDRDAVDRDCQRLVAWLCALLTGPHRHSLEALGGWDGFCHFKTPLRRTFWRKLLIKIVLLLATALVYFLARVYKF